MSKPIIAVDVDCVLVNPIQKWMDWLKNNSKMFDARKYKLDLQQGKVNYKLSKYFHLNNRVDGMDFWRQKDIYDDLSCFTDAKTILEKLYFNGFDIIFVSYCFSEHENSKIALLKREFPFIDKEDFVFISTKHKGYVNCDIVIDDRLDMLNQFGDNVTKILMHTPYTQYEEHKQGTLFAYNWIEVGEILNDFRNKLDVCYSLGIVKE